MHHSPPVSHSINKSYSSGTESAQGVKLIWMRKKLDPGTPSQRWNHPFMQTNSYKDWPHRLLHSSKNAIDLEWCQPQHYLHHRKKNIPLHRLEFWLAIAVTKGQGVETHFSTTKTIAMGRRPKCLIEYIRENTLLSPYSELKLRLHLYKMGRFQDFYVVHRVASSLTCSNDCAIDRIHNMQCVH